MQEQIPYANALGTITFAPKWEPLQATVQSDELGDWMYIGTRELESGDVIHLYKHSLTRMYLNLSDDGRAWKYSAESVGYIEIPREEALAHARAPQPVQELEVEINQ